MNLKQELEKRGANDSQLRSKTLEMVEEIIAEESGAIDKIGYESAKSIKREITESVRAAESIAKRLRQDAWQWEDTYKKVKNAEVNPSTAEVVGFYKYMLNATLECIGATPSDDIVHSQVIGQAVESIGYIVWKCIDEGIIQGNERKPRVY